MIAFICNHCKKPIDMEKKHCVHIKISYGEKAIINKGQYADGWDADLCEDCWNKLCPLIDEYYYGGNKHLIDHPTEKGGAEEVKHGEWIENRKVSASPYCSLCGAVGDRGNYCSHCGANMKGD